MDADDVYSPSLDKSVDSALAELRGRVAALEAELLKLTGQPKMVDGLIVWVKPT